MESIWQKSVSLPSFPQLKGNVKADVLVVGGGIAGILTAYFLKANGVDCILAEKGKLCQGTTSGTTAKITFQHGLIYQKLAEQVGIEAAGRYLEANRLAVEAYARLCRTVDCDYEKKDSFIYSRTDRNQLEQELSVLEKIGYRAEFCESLPLPFPTVGAVKFPNQAQFHPLKFLAALTQKLCIYENTFVQEIRGRTAVTEFGTITAEHVIVATHFPFLNRHGCYFLKLYQHRSYVLALEHAENLNGMYLDENQTGLSLRSYGPYLLLGGGAHRTGKQGGGWQELCRCAKHFYPQARESCRWAAQDCISLDGMPYIGRYSNRTAALYTATGFCKWGITGAMVSAQLLCDLILGRHNEFAELFCPSRTMFKPQLLRNGLESVTNLLSFGKRCPHLGCALKWNAAEHSWDCACHGSRFDEHGKVLDNPANGA